MKKQSIGDTLLDLEPLLEQLVDSHELQRGEILALINSWITIHRPGCIEEYTDGSQPELYYGPRRSK